MKNQQTIKNEITFSGIGLHTGRSVNVRILPANEDSGISFVRKDISGAPAIKAAGANVVATSYATSLGNNGVTIGTVEHIMAALYGMGIDNATVELDGPEVPIMDGSAAYFIELIEKTGIEAQSAPRKYLIVKMPMKVSDKDKYVLLLPSEDASLAVDYHIDFSHSLLNKQSFSRHLTGQVFANEIGSARTFGFLRDAEALRANGLARGASLDNAVVLSDTEILNEGGLRYPDEFVRHKVLDMIGDISLVGYQIIGKVVAHRAGHALNHRLVEEILDKSGRWELSENPSEYASPFTIDQNGQTAVSLDEYAVI